MDLRQALLSEHSKAQTRFIAGYIGGDPGRFGELMHLFLGDEYRVTQRAGWVVSECCEQFPQLIIPYILPMLENLGKQHLHNAVRRNTLRVLSFVELPEDSRGLAADLCFRILDNPAGAIAVRAHAMSVLENLCTAIPELQHEFELHLSALPEQNIPALTSRANKIFGRLRRSTTRR
jgi:hypothetical protein